MSMELRGYLPDDANVERDLTPAEHLRAEIERLGLDQGEVSNATGVSRQSINNIVNGRQPISRAMAARLGRLTGRSSDYWLRASFPRLLASPPNFTIGNSSEEAVVRPLGAEILVNHQIAKAVKDGTIVIEPFDPANVQLASVDLTLDDFIITTAGERLDISDGQVFVLRGGQTVIVSTKEWLQFPIDYIGRVGAMTRLAKYGLVISHGFQIDPGYQGHLGFCIFNAGGRDFELRSGEPIISLEIMRLSANPKTDAKALKHLDDAKDNSKVIALFRSDVCSRLIRDSIRARAEAETQEDGVKASISELDVEFEAASADHAISAAVDAVLSGLKIVRENPNASRDTRQKFDVFFSEIADHLHLSADQARQAANCIGSTTESNSTLIVVLRDGTEVMVYLPTKSATVSLKHLARQLRREIGELVLDLTGFRTGSETPDPNVKSINKS
jgi:deoxycytidine triphosphate deaminase/addiction module HigA family antidote